MDSVHLVGLVDALVDELVLEHPAGLVDVQEVGQVDVLEQEHLVELVVAPEVELVDEQVHERVVAPEVELVDEQVHQRVVAPEVELFVYEADTIEYKCS